MSLLNALFYNALEMSNNFATQCALLEVRYTAQHGGANTIICEDAEIPMLPDEVPLVAVGVNNNLIITSAGRIIGPHDYAAGNARVLDPKHTPMLDQLASLLMEAETCDPSFDRQYCELVLLEVIKAVSRPIETGSA
jgi:hypothetical protein